jgi:hypothetical protein
MRRGSFWGIVQRLAGDVQALRFSLRSRWQHTQTCGNDSRITAFKRGVHLKRKATRMKKLLSITGAALLIAGLSAAPASAKKRHHMAQGRSQMTTGASPMARGNNAELMGNNATSAEGSNSLGHLLGGNNGSGR